MGEEERVKKIESLIKASLKQGSVFRLRDDLRFEPDNNASENKEEAVQLLIANGVFTLHDFFLLSMVNSLGHATVPVIMRKLALEKRRNPQLEIPCYDLRALKKRLRMLVQHGLLYSFAYEAENVDSRVVIYVCTMLGYRVFRTRLMMNVPYDKLAMYRSTSDIFRRLSANSVAFSFAANELCGGVILNELISYGDDARQKKLSLYARTSLEKDNRKRRYIIEPVYFNVEQDIITDEQNLKQIDERITQIQDMIEFYMEKEDWDVRLVFVVEDLDGLMKLLALLKRKELSFFMKYATFTAENVIANNSYRLDTSFMKMSISRGRSAMVLDEESILA